MRSEISLEGCTQLETDLWRDVPSGQGGAGSAWKAVLSEAVVTGGEALGKSKQCGCLKDSTLNPNGQ